MNIIEREQWKSKEIGVTYTPMAQLKGFVVHHTAGAPVRAGEGDSAMRSMQRQHRKKSPPWIDIGYHYVIIQDGTIYRGRPLVDGRHVHAAHSPGLNHTHIGICLTGCFHPPAENCANEPMFRQVLALVGLCRSIMVEERLGPETQLLGHRDCRATDCPGDKLYALLDEVRGLIEGPHTVHLPRPKGPESL